MLEDANILEQMRQLAEARKFIVPTQWQEIPHKSISKLEYVSTLEIDGIVAEGARLRGRTLKNAPDSDLTFQIEMRYGSFWHPLCRLDWRPKRPHTDQAGPIGERRSFSGSGWHSFSNNASYGLWALRDGNLPRAVPLDPDPQNFNDVLNMIKTMMMVENVEAIPRPEWDMQGRLL
jgi:hypothetical protein